jgi:4-amino-4-deoxy-L-arabinose transferase-like glycosyltransferase
MDSVPKLGPTSRARLAGSKSRWLVLLVILLAMALQIHGLDSKSLWFDELATLTGAAWRGSFLDAIHYPLTIPTTPKPPLSFIVTHIFLAWDNSVFALRLPSVLLATLSIPLIYLLGKSLFDEQVGLLTALLLAIAPFYLRYAQEARMYVMLTFLAVLSLYLFWRAVRSNKILWWLAWALAASLALYTHLFAILTLAVMCFVALGLGLRPRERYPFRPWHFILAAALIALSFLPMVPYFFQGLAGDEGLGGEAAAGWNLTLVWSAIRLFSGGNNASLPAYSILLLVGVALLAVKRRDLLILATMWMILPPILVLATPFGHAVRLRYFIFALPVYLLLVALGLKEVSSWLTLRLAHSPGTWAGVGIGGALLLGLGGLTAPSLLSYYAETKQNWRDAAWSVGTLAKPGDTIYVTQVYHREGLLFYASQWPEQQVVTPDAVRLLPKDVTAAFPLSDDHEYWLVAPIRDKFQPGSDWAESLEPYHQVQPAVTLVPSMVPEDAEIIGPTTFRSLAVLQVTATRPPSVRFWADNATLVGSGCTWLRWDVQNVVQVYLDGQGVVGLGEEQVCPAATTDYVLKVVYLNGTVIERTVQVAVLAP